MESMSKRRGIRLKDLDPDDPGIQELMDSDFCVPDDPDPPEPPEPPQPPEPHVPSPREIAREVIAALEETLVLLGRDPPDPDDGAAPPDEDHGPA